MSDLFNEFTQKGGELVPLGREPGADDASPGSPFDRFLGRLVPGEPPDDDYTRALLYGAVGSLLALGGAFLLAALPSSEAIRASDLFLLGDITLGKIVDGAGTLAGPLAILAGLLLVATGVLWISGRRDDLTATVCVVQPVVGVLAVAGSAIPWTLVLAAALLTIVLYVILTIIAVAILFGLLLGALE